MTGAATQARPEAVARSRAPGAASARLFRQPPASALAAADVPAQATAP